MYDTESTVIMVTMAQGQITMTTDSEFHMQSHSSQHVKIS